MEQSRLSPFFPERRLLLWWLPGESSAILAGHDFRGNSALRRLCSLSLNKHCVQRLAGSHKQPILLRPSETQIGTGFRKMNFPDQRAIWRKYVDSVISLTSPSCSGPNVSVYIAT